MQALLNLQKGENKRALSDDENTEFTTLKSEVEALNGEIENADFVERNGGPVPTPTPTPAPIQAPQIQRKASKVYNISRAIQGLANGTLNGLELETKQEIERGLGFRSKGILIPSTPLYRANENTTTTDAAVLETFVDPDVSIFGKEPLYQLMGCTVLNGVTGSIKLTKKAAAVGKQTAEESAVANASDNPATGDTLTPKRYGDMDTWTAETLAQQNPVIHAKLVADLIKGADRKITADVYTHILAAATAVATGAITETGLNALMNSVDGDGAFIMSRATFFEGKAIKFDTGSGLRLFNAVKGNNGVGESWEGVPAFYSQLFDDGTAKQYLAYGDMSELYIALWGGVELLLDPYTLAANGETRIIVNRLADMGIRNSLAFGISPDLDATT